ncbi:hypothetical protein GCM10025787_47160 [Saccharopolyspora rosea]|uniref:MarR family winged helix-turn-helix transcriptional regulator n=1 Tax=Saccharopolyspora rosea TaxID=524884 RepID=A0ABW3G3N4_9PSEU
MHAAEELRYLILAAQREGNRLLAQALRPLGLTPAQAEVIRILSDHQPLTLNGLGELLVCDSGQSPSRLIGRLVAKGFIERQPSDTDRRAVELTLTGEGTDLAEQVTQAEDNLYAAISTALDQQDTRPLADVLWTLVAGTPAGQALARRAGKANGH